jgi:iron complex transport system permease protein
MTKQSGWNLALAAACLLVISLDLITGTQSWNDLSFINFRIPRVAAAVISGLGLSVCGLALQTLFRNPLAGPFLTGISPGASFTVAMMLLAVPGGFAAAWSQTLGIALAGMLGGLGVLLLQLYIQQRNPGTFTLLISGILLGYLLGAGVEILQSLAGAEQVKQFIMWGLGSFDRVQNEHLLVLISITTAGVAMIWLCRFRMDAYLPGDHYATNAGVDVYKLRLTIIIASGLIAGVITGFCGPIGFVGMIAPHLARFMVKSNNHGLLWLPTMLCGILLCALADWLAHYAIPGITLPTNAVCALLGAPMVLWFILQKRL